MTPTPRELADVACDNWRKDLHAHWTLPMHVEHAIKEAISDQTAALQAALEALAKAKQQAHDSHIEVGHASAALNRVLLHVTGCSAGEFDTYMETAERIIAHLKDDAQHLKETSEAFVQTTNELLEAQKELAKAKQERDGLAAALDSLSDEGFDGTPKEMEACRIVLAAHDRAVAARVLDYWATFLPHREANFMQDVAAKYRSGQREVPHA